MQDAGSAFIGIGNASGENRCGEAASNAINSASLRPIGGRCQRCTVYHCRWFWYDNVWNSRSRQLLPNRLILTPKLFWCYSWRQTQKSEIRVTVIACGFPESQKKKGGLFGFDSNNKETEVAKATFKWCSTLNNPAPDTSSYPVIEPENQSDGDDEDDWSSIPAF